MTAIAERLAAPFRRPRAALAGGWQTLSWIHRCWFFAFFLGSLTFLLFIPPFQTNDEPSHWRRLWSTAGGHLTCGAMPSVVDNALSAADYFGVREHGKPYKFGNLDELAAIKGANGVVRATGNACVYIPIAYLLPAAAMLPFVHPYDPRRSAGLLPAFYASRAANWLTMGIAVFVFLLLTPQLRNLTLVLYSLPMVMQQTTVVNQEACTLACAFVLLLLWWQRPSLAQVIGLLVVAAILMAMKATFLVLLLWWACALWRWKRLVAPPRWQVALAASLALIPLVIQAAWSRLVVSVSGSDFLPGWGVDPGRQVEFLKAHPLHLLRVMWNGHMDFLGRGHMNGGWTGVLGVLGWADFEIGDRAYALLFLAVVLAVVADFAAPPPAEAPVADPSPWLEYILPIFSVYLLLPSVIFAMFMVFTRVGAPAAIGVQGRYLLFPDFVMLALAIEWARRRWSARPVERARATVERVRAARGWLAAACAVCCMVAAHDALRAILTKYYE